jgi:hypothetical protein
MSFIKILVVALAISLLVMWWKRSLIARIRREYDEEESPRQRKNMPKHQEMVRCSYCDVYVPVEEAIKSRNHYYCSKEHHKKAIERQ